MAVARFVVLCVVGFWSPNALEGQDRPYTLQNGRIVAVDTSVYADIATAEIVELARARHSGTALQLQGYDAKIFTRLEGRAASSRFGRGLTLFTYETAANLSWEQPGDVRIDVQGIRSAAPRVPGLNRDGWATWWSEIFSDQLWFSPSALGDEIQLMGLPDEDAIHPLARDADRLYRYALKDSVTMVGVDRTVRVLAVRVEPRMLNPVLERMPAQRTGASAEPDASAEADSGRPDPEMQDILDRLADYRARTASGELDAGSPEAQRTLNRILSELQSPQRGARVNRRSRTYSPTLVSGDLWIDADSLDMVRLRVAFLGDNIWDDDPDAPELLTVEADLEYSLFEARHWLPSRQTLAATFKFKYLPGALLPTTAVTTFTDYEIRDTPQPVLEVNLPPDVTGRRSGAWRCPEPWEFSTPPGAEDCAEDPYVKAGIENDGTQWEIHVPPLDSLLAFDFGTDFSHNVDLASDEFVQQRLSHLAYLSADIPSQFRPERGAVIDWTKTLGAFHFNRVQGASLGGGVSWAPGPAFTDVLVSGRFGFGDLRPVGSVTWRRDAPHGRLDLTSYRRLAEAEPWSQGVSLGNSMKALFSGHDDADYYLALGGGITYEVRTGPLRDGLVSIYAERHESVARAAGSTVNNVLFGNGRFQQNPAVAGGDFVGGMIQKSFFAGGSVMGLGVEGLTGNPGTGSRAWATADFPFAHGETLGRVRAKGGWVVGDSLPQLQFRAGGPETVRGYAYGARVGRSLWSLQADIEWEVSQWWSPLLFADAGDVDGFGSPLIGLGAGVTALSGWIRLELAKGVSPAGKLRADFLVQIPVN